MVGLGEGRCPPNGVKRAEKLTKGCSSGIIGKEMTPMSQRSRMGNSATQLGKAIQSILQVHANRAGVSTGLIKRVREFTGATFAQTMILGHRPRRRDRDE